MGPAGEPRLSVLNTTLILLTMPIRLCADSIFCPISSALLIVSALIGGMPPINAVMVLLVIENKDLSVSELIFQWSFFGVRINF